MRTREILEWLSLAPADIPCWLAAGVVVGMWFAGSLLLAIALAIVAILLSLVACYLGMPPRDEFGKSTNVAKLVAYPLYVILVIIIAGVIIAIRPYPG